MYPESVRERLARYHRAALREIAICSSPDARERCRAWDKLEAIIPELADALADLLELEAMEEAEDGL